MLLVNNILLINFSVKCLAKSKIEELKKAIKLVNKKAKLEASGNMTIERVKRISNFGLDFISVGAITHSAPNLDLSLEVVCE